MKSKPAADNTPPRTKDSFQVLAALSNQKIHRMLQKVAKRGTRNKERSAAQSPLPPKNQDTTKETQ